MKEQRTLTQKLKKKLSGFNKKKDCLLLLSFLHQCFSETNGEILVY